MYALQSSPGKTDSEKEKEKSFPSSPPLIELSSSSPVPSRRSVSPKIKSFAPIVLRRPVPVKKLEYVRALSRARPPAPASLVEFLRKTPQIFESFENRKDDSRAMRLVQKTCALLESMTPDPALLQVVYNETKGSAGGVIFELLPQGAETVYAKEDEVGPMMKPESSMVVVEAGRALAAAREDSAAVKEVNSTENEGVQLVEVDREDFEGQEDHGEGVEFVEIYREDKEENFERRRPREKMQAENGYGRDFEELNREDKRRRLEMDRASLELIGARGERNENERVNHRELLELDKKDQVDFVDLDIESFGERRNRGDFSERPTASSSGLFATSSGLSISELLARLPTPIFTPAVPSSSLGSRRRRREMGGSPQRVSVTKLGTHIFSPRTPEAILAFRSRKVIFPRRRIEKKLRIKQRQPSRRNPEAGPPTLIYNIAEDFYLMEKLLEFESTLALRTLTKSDFVRQFVPQINRSYFAAGKRMNRLKSSSPKFKIALFFYCQAFRPVCEARKIVGAGERFAVESMNPDSPVSPEEKQYISHLNRTLETQLLPEIEKLKSIVDVIPRKYTGDFDRKLDVDEYFSSFYFARLVSGLLEKRRWAALGPSDAFAEVSRLSSPEQFDFLRIIDGINEENRKSSGRVLIFERNLSDSVLASVQRLVSGLSLKLSISESEIIDNLGMSFHSN